MQSSHHAVALRLWQTMQTICKELTGGEAILQGENAVVKVLDCPVWTARASAMLRAVHETALISIEPSSLSLSGFIVVVSEKHNGDFSTTAPPHSPWRWWAWGPALSASLLFLLCCSTSCALPSPFSYHDTVCRHMAGLLLPPFFSI